MMIGEFIKKSTDRVKYLVDYAVWGFQSDHIRKFDRVMALERPEIRKVIIRNYATLEELLRTTSKMQPFSPTSTGRNQPDGQNYRDEFAKKFEPI